MASYAGVRPQEILVALEAGISPLLFIGWRRFFCNVSAPPRPGRDVVSLSDDGSVYFDNRLAVETFAVGCGDKQENIAVLPYCTSCDQEDFFLTVAIKAVPAAKDFLLH